MAFLRALAKRNAVEYITLETSDDSAKSGNFNNFKKDTISDIIIQNLTSYGCYFKFGIEPVTADDGCLYIPGNSDLSLDNVAFTYFSVLRETTNNVKLRITGIGLSS